MTVDAGDPCRELTLADVRATQALAGRLGDLLAPGDVVGLAGALGIGKTTFARALIRHLLGPDLEVPSPTFNLVLIYDLPQATLWHFDLYRLKAPAEAYELGIEEAFADGISLIEWPEQLGHLLPRDHLLVTLAPGAGAEARRVRLAGAGNWAGRLHWLVGSG